MMLAQYSLGSVSLHWESWIAPAAVLGFAGLALIMVLGFLRSRKQVPPPAPAPETPLAWDPFDQGSTSERRSSIRRAGKTIKVLISDAEGVAEPYQGLVCDRSLGGLCLAVPRAVEENTILSVRALDANATTPWIQVEVKRCSANNDHWELGCRFVRTPPYSQLLSFG